MPGALPVGDERAVLGLEYAVEQHALDAHVVVEVLEVNELRERGGRVEVDRWPAVKRQRHPVRAAQPVDPQQLGDPSAPGDVGLHHVDRARVEVPAERVHMYGVVGVGKKNGKAFEITGMVEKPKRDEAPSNLIITGRYILQPQIFGILADQTRGAGGEIQITDAMIRLAKTQRFYGLKFEGQSYDCGSKVGFLAANVAYALQVTGGSRKEIRAKVPDILRLTGLATKLHNYPDQLSGGEQQRVSIARAFVDATSTAVGSSRATSAAKACSFG